MVHTRQAYVYILNYAICVSRALGNLEFKFSFRPTSKKFSSFSLPKRPWMHVTYRCNHIKVLG